MSAFAKFSRRLRNRLRCASVLARVTAGKPPRRALTLLLKCSFRFTRLLLRVLGALRMKNLPSNYELARCTALVAYRSWSSVDKDDSAAHAWWLFCSLLRLSDSEIEPTERGYRVRGVTRSGASFEASGPTIHEAVEKALM